MTTLFDPWKRDIHHVENAPIDVLFRIWIENLISRFIGLILRLSTVIGGILMTVIIFILMLIFLLLWITLPFVILYLLFNGVSLVANG